MASMFARQQVYLFYATCNADTMSEHLRAIAADGCYLLKTDSACL